MGTPKRPSGIHPQFSPVFVPDSPVKLTGQKGNLTGNVRVVRDLAADLYNWVQTWNKHHLDGYSIVKNIADLKVPALKNEEADKNRRLYPDGLEDLCNELKTVCDKLDETVAGMKQVTRQMEAVIAIEKMHKREESPMFLTWTAERFGNVFRQISSAYEQELKVRHCVYSEVAHCQKEGALMLHLAAWVYQPFISNNDEVALEALLVETGHH